MNRLKKLLKDHQIITNAIGYTSVVIIALNINPSSLTHWYMIKDCVFNVFKSPYQTGLLVVATVGYFTNSKK
jgi:hypothetical protein